MEKLIKNKKIIIMVIIILVLIIAGIVFFTTRLTSTEKEVIKIVNNLYIEDDESYTVTKLKDAKKIDMKRSFDEDELKEVYSDNGVNENKHVYLIDVITKEDGRFTAIVSEDGKIMDKTESDTADEEYDNLIFINDKIDIDRINKKID